MVLGGLCSPFPCPILPGHLPLLLAWGPAWGPTGPRAEQPLPPARIGVGELLQWVPFFLQGPPHSPRWHRWGTKPHRAEIWGENYRGRGGDHNIPARSKVFLGGGVLGSASFSIPCPLPGATGAGSTEPPRQGPPVAARGSGRGGAESGGPGTGTGTGRLRSGGGGGSGTPVAPGPGGSGGSRQVGLGCGQAWGGDHFFPPFPPVPPSPRRRRRDLQGWGGISKRDFFVFLFLFFWEGGCEIF